MLALLAAFSLRGANGQRPPPGGGATCTSRGLVQCSQEPPYTFSVGMGFDNTFLSITTNGCPPYAGPNWNNPNQACEFSRTYRIPRRPRVAQTPIPVGTVHSVYQGVTYLREDPGPILGAIGVFLNGVNIYGVGSPCGFGSPCPDQGGPTRYVDAVESEGHTVDMCGGHASPQNQYHLHSGIGINTTAGRQTCRLSVDRDGQHSELLGWMFDGYGIYGQYSLNGVIPDDLDECGGHTHLLNGVEVYHYHLPTGFPWIIGCYRGCPEASNNQRELGSLVSNPIYGCQDNTTATATTGDANATATTGDANATATTGDANATPDTVGSGGPKTIPLIGSFSLILLAIVSLMM